MATTLFTKKRQHLLLKYWEAAPAMLLLFFACSYFSTPTSMVSSMGNSREIIKSIELEREYNEVVSHRSMSKGYSDFYEIKMVETDTVYRISLNSRMVEIKRYGINKMIGKQVYLQFNQKKDYRAIRELRFEGQIIVSKNDRGFFPYLLFVLLTLIFLVWSIWGFNITYLVSDERRKEFEIK